MEKEDFIIVLTTFPANGDVDAFAKGLVDARLAACVNILPPMRSIYSWKGSTEKTEEHQLVIKTTADRRDELETRLKSLHPYETPEFLVVASSGGSREYLAYLAESTKK